MKILVDIEETITSLLQQEDTIQDKKITIEDQGLKSFTLNGVDTIAYNIEGTYHLSNLLQELALARSLGQRELEVDLSKIEELPVNRITRFIRNYFWNNLTRTIDEQGIVKVLEDEKVRSGTHRVYVPFSDSEGFEYFGKVAKKLKLELIRIPSNVTLEYLSSIIHKPGLLSLKIKNGNGVPFLVPGGRFNEMYGWDSYFIGVGLLVDGRYDLAKAMIDNLCYQIEHYGKILNANRSYYLDRTQPPFLTSFIRELMEKDNSIPLKWLKKALESAIKEYHTVWMVMGKRLTSNGLNRYYAEGKGIPLGTEKNHFEQVLCEYAPLYELTVDELAENYQNGIGSYPELDTYFSHDRSIRESGHDTSYRLDRCSAHLNTVDLNCMLYKYESDIAYLIKTYFEGNLDSQKEEGISVFWEDRCTLRKSLIQEYLWDENLGMFSDYDFVEEKITTYESATNFLPLWAGICTEKQARILVSDLMKKFKQKGGVVGTSKAMMLQIAEEMPRKQWDYPNGWAPHQILLWRGLFNYGYTKEMQELIYRWLWCITVNYVNYNGVVTEKYNVIDCTHKVHDEYGNVGSEFEYVATHGFGWTNASYQFGLSLLSNRLKRKLNALIDPDEIF